MARLLCPSCGRTFGYEGGGAASCPHCGYASSVASVGAAGTPVPATPYAPSYEAAYEPPPLPGAPLAGEGRKTNGLAVASLVLGILSILGGFFLVVPPILAFVFALVALGQVRRRGDAGKGMAIAGLVLSSIVLTFYLFFLTMSLLFGFP